jgi:hypothetical protein
LLEIPQKYPQILILETAGILKCQEYLYAFFRVKHRWWHIIDHELLKTKNYSCIIDCNNCGRYSHSTSSADGLDKKPRKLCGGESS